MRTTISFIILGAFSLIISNCVNGSVEINHCYEGTVIGKIRSWGGRVAVSMKEPKFSNHTWRNYEHVVEALNIPDSLWIPGKVKEPFPYQLMVMNRQNPLFMFQMFRQLNALKKRKGEATK